MCMGASPYTLGVGGGGGGYPLKTLSNKEKGLYQGRQIGTKESNEKFLYKPKNQEIFKLLERGLKYSEIQKIVGCSPNLIKKVKEQIKYEVN